MNDIIDDKIDKWEHEDHKLIKQMFGNVGIAKEFIQDLKEIKAHKEDGIYCYIRCFPIDTFHPIV